MQQSEIDGLAYGVGDGGASGSSVSAFIILNGLASSIFVMVASD